MSGSYPGGQSRETVKRAKDMQAEEAAAVKRPPANPRKAPVAAKPASNPSKEPPTK